MNSLIETGVMQGGEVTTQPIGDLHICGACKAQFHDIDIFLLHKRQSCIANHTTTQDALRSRPSTSATHHTHFPKHQAGLFFNNNNHHHGMVDAPEMMEERGPEVGKRAEEAMTGGQRKTTADGVVLVQVPTENVGHNTRGLDATANGVVSLQNALMSTATAATSGEQPMVMSTHPDGGDDTQSDPGVQVVQQLLGSAPNMSAHQLEEYTAGTPSLLQVLQGNVTGVEVDNASTAATTYDLQLEAAHTDDLVISKGLKKVSLSQTQGVTKKYKCDHEDCTFSTVYQKDLDRHRRIHTGERPFSCHLCEKAFNRADKLKAHIRAHSGNKPYACTQCNYATSDSSSLKKHLRIHSDERPFKCQICQYASRNSSQLIVHLRTHTGDAPFQCQMCTAKFKINSDLKRHLRLHTGEKPYRCEHCDYRCAIKGNLKAHYKINHSTDRVLVCDQCSEFSTSSPRALREHVKTHDTYEMTYRCPICKYTCATRTTLKVHLRVHSTERPYKCRYCPFSSKQSGNVGTHIRRKHMDMLHGNTHRISRINQHHNQQHHHRDGGHQKTGGCVNGVVSGGAGVGGGATSKEKKMANRLKPVVKKPFKCSKCGDCFVRQDSLRSHVRHHKEVERDLAQKLETTVQAVLQLSTPVSLDPNHPVNTHRPDDSPHIISTNSNNKSGVDDDHRYKTGLTDIAHATGVVGSSMHSHPGGIVVEEVTVAPVLVPDLSPPPVPPPVASPPAQPAPSTAQRTAQRAAPSSSASAHHTAADKPNNSGSSSSSSSPPSISPSTTTTTSSSRSRAGNRPVHSYNQVLSNRLAFVQNNQNQAIEENYQNQVINSRRMAAAAATAAADAAGGAGESSHGGSPVESSSTSNRSSNSKQSGYKNNPGPSRTGNNVSTTGSGSGHSKTMLRGMTENNFTQSSPSPPGVYQSPPQTPPRSRPARPVFSRTMSPPEGHLVLSSAEPMNQQHPQLQLQHQESPVLHEQDETITTSVLQHQLVTASPTQQHQIAQQQQEQTQQQQHLVNIQDVDGKTQQVQLTLQVAQSLAEAMSPLTSTGISGNTIQVVPAQPQQLRSQQVITTPTILNVQQPQQQQQQQQFQLQQQHTQQQQHQQQVVVSGANPVNLQFLQSASGGSQVVPQQVQLLLPASALTHTSTGTIQVAPPGQYQQQVILQVPAGTEGLLDSSGQFQIPVPLRILPAQQQQVINRVQQQQQQPDQQQQQQQQLTEQQPQVITLQTLQTQEQQRQYSQQQQDQAVVQQLQQQRVLQQQQQLQLQAQLQQHQQNAVGVVYEQKKSL